MQARGKLENLISFIDDVNARKIDINQPFVLDLERVADKIVVDLEYQDKLVEALQNENCPKSITINLKGTGLPNIQLFVSSFNTKPNYLISLTLDLSRVDLTEKDLLELLKLTNNPTCPQIKLVLRLCNLQLQAALELANTLENGVYFPNVFVLDLSCNLLTNKGLKAILDVIGSGIQLDKFFIGLSQTKAWPEKEDILKAVRYLSIIGLSFDDPVIAHCLKRNNLLLKYSHNQDMVNLIKSISKKQQKYQGLISSPSLMFLAAKSFVQHTSDDRQAENLPQEVKEFIERTRVNVNDISCLVQTPSQRFNNC